MNKVSKSELKARMLEYLREVEETGEELVITHNRTPVLRIVPYEKELSVDEIFGPLRKLYSEKGDLTEPTMDAWPQLKDM